MSDAILCPNGHLWEISVDSEGTPGPAVLVCPICGVPCAEPTANPRTVSISASLVYSEKPRVAASSVSLPNVPGYDVVSLLGQGGMGKVFKAKHRRLDRVVALKMITTDQASMVQRVRFQVEGQALAKLDHPNIVQIHDVGEFNETPYFSLEFVEGGSLDRKLAATPQPPLAAAQMVQTLARAIHVAHQHGIVHRDLKPANILLSMDGQPKITDFGLAKRLEDESSQTRTGELLGTPAYMAPEQTIGDAKAIGPLTDVYALGVILYEMLTGRVPFRGVNTLETLQLIRFSEPVPPKRMQPGVPRDLETICLKCMEKVPAKRYASAAELAEDVTRFLSHQPIRARRAGLSERLAKWVRRNPAAAALVGVILAALLALGILGAWSNASLRFLAQRADQRSRMARSVVDDLYTQFAEEWLAEEPYKDPVRQEFLEKALRLYQEFAEEDTPDPSVRRETALAHFRLGQIHRILNKHPRAEKAYRQAIALQEELRDQFPMECSYRQDLANSHNWLGELFRETGVLAEAEHHFAEAMELQENLLAETPNDPAYRKELARSHYNLAIILMDTSRPDAAAKSLARAFSLLAGLHTQFPTVAEYRHEWARCFINRGVLHKGNRVFAEAEEDYRRAIELLGPLTPTFAAKGDGPFRVVYRTDLAVAHRNLGNLLLSQGKYAKAHEEMTSALVILKKLREDFPNRPAYQKKLADTHNSLGSVLANAKKYDGAEANYHEARKLFDVLVKEHADVAEYQQVLGITIGNLGWLRSEQRDWAAAREHYQQAIQHLAKAQQTNPKNRDGARALGNQYQSLAESAIQLGDHTAAAEAAIAMTHVDRDPAQDRYYAACFLARCVPLAKKDPHLADPVHRETCAQKYAEQALSMLERAGGAGSVIRLPNENEIFQALREQPRLQKLLSDLDGKRKS